MTTQAAKAGREFPKKNLKHADLVEKTQQSNGVVAQFIEIWEHPTYGVRAKIQPPGDQEYLIYIDRDCPTGYEDSWKQIAQGGTYWIYASATGVAFYDPATQGAPDAMATAPPPPPAPPAPPSPQAAPPQPQAPPTPQPAPQAAPPQPQPAPPPQAVPQAAAPSMCYPYGSALLAEYAKVSVAAHMIEGILGDEIEDLTPYERADLVLRMAAHLSGEMRTAKQAFGEVIPLAGEKYLTPPSWIGNAPATPAPGPAPEYETERPYGDDDLPF